MGIHHSRVPQSDLVCFNQIDTQKNHNLSSLFSEAMLWFVNNL